MKKKRIAFISIFVVFVLCISGCIVLFRPVNISRSNCEVFQGTLIKVIPNEQTKDIGLRLDGVDNRFYINRGLENDSIEKELIALINEPIAVYVAKHWTPLDPENKSKHVCQVECNGQVLYTEF